LPSYDGALSTRQSVYGRTTPARNTEYDHRQKTLSQNLEDDLKGEDDVAVALPSEPVPAKLPGIFALLFQHLPSMPSKHLVVLGILGSIGHGISTPVWSAFLTRLMQAVGTGGDSPGLTENALIVLAISAAQAIAYFLQEFCLNAVASHWTAKIRGDAYASVLSQDKAWFDEPENAPSRLVQILVKDADDMRALMSQVVAKFSVFVAMVGLGIIWAMIIQWRLTLVGVAMAPAFAIIIMVNEVLIGKAERRNKTKREALAKTFYEVGHNRGQSRHGGLLTSARAWRMYEAFVRWRSRGLSGRNSSPKLSLRRRRVKTQDTSLPLERLQSPRYPCGQWVGPDSERASHFRANQISAHELRRITLRPVKLHELRAHAHRLQSRTLLPHLWHPGS
jgi:hypothetical protein